MSTEFQVRQIADMLFEVVCDKCDYNLDSNAFKCEKKTCIVTDLARDYNEIITDDIRKDEDI